MDMKNTRKRKGRNLHLGKKMVEAMACNKDEGNTMSACYRVKDPMAVPIFPIAFHFCNPHSQFSGFGT